MSSRATWTGVYIKTSPTSHELVALFKRPDALPTRLDLLPKDYELIPREIILRPAPITAFEGSVELTNALDLLDAVVNGNDQELGQVLEKAGAFLREHGKIST